MSKKPRKISKLSKSAQRYLRAVYELIHFDGSASPYAIAEYLGYDCSARLSRIRGKCVLMGYTQEGTSGYNKVFIILTPKGKEYAQTLAGTSSPYYQGASDIKPPVADKYKGRRYEDVCPRVLAAEALRDRGRVSRPLNHSNMGGMYARIAEA